MCGTPQRSRRTSTELSSPVRPTRPSTTASGARAQSRRPSREKCAKAGGGRRLVRRASCALAAPAETASRANVTRRAFTPTNLAHAVADAAPTNVGKGRQRPIARVRVAHLSITVARTWTVRVIHDERTPAHVVTRDDAPIATVLGAVAIVAHHEVVARWDPQRSPIVMGSHGGRIAEAAAANLDAMLPRKEIARGIHLRGVDVIRRRRETLALR